MTDEPVDFMKRRLVVVRCAAWFSRCDKTFPGAKAIERYIGLVEPDATITIFRGIDADKLAMEKEMVATHNARIDALGDASAATALKASQPIASTSIEAGRKQATAQRGGPSPLFRSNSQDAE
jgi:hypothetical protein